MNTEDGQKDAGTVSFFIRTGIRGPRMSGMPKYTAR